MLGQPTPGYRALSAATRLEAPNRNGKIGPRQPLTTCGARRDHPGAEAPAGGSSYGGAATPWQAK